MYKLAFSGNTDVPILYSYDNVQWYKPDGQKYKNVKITDNIPVPGRNYNVDDVPSSNYVVVTINIRQNPILISEGGYVYLLVSDTQIPGKDYYIDFYLSCPIPMGVKGNKMVFKPSNMINEPIYLNLPEYPFFDNVSNKILKSGNVNVDGEGNITLNDKNIHITCDNTISDFFKRIKDSCVPVTLNTLESEFKDVDIYLIDGFNGYFVVKYSDNVIEVYTLKYVVGMSYLNFGYYQITDIVSGWNEYYERRLNFKESYDINDDVYSVYETMDMDALQDISQKYNILYVQLLLYIWYNMTDVTVAERIKSNKTDTNYYTNVYNPFGEKIMDLLSKELEGSSWEYIGPDIYAMDPNKRSGSSKIIINAPDEQIIITSPSPFEPRITIGGSQYSGKYLSSITELPKSTHRVEIMTTQY